jgi:three-Cys-motif partner protein
MPEQNFFEEQKEQSEVKSTIVSKYFNAWAKVIIATQKKYPRDPQKIAYIDLFAGPGRYKDGTISTPEKILISAINDPDLRGRLVSIFNDKDSDYSKSLKACIATIPGIETLKYKPKVHNDEVGEEIVKMFDGMNIVPTLFFVDPWGYKGLSLKLINSVLKDWGCDAIFFFNYNRINMGLNNEFVVSHIEALLGEGKIESVREKVEGKNPVERELLIVDHLCEELKSHGAEYVLPFRFKHNKGKRTSHHLIFVSKHFRGYDIMKEIMAKESTSNAEGVPSFEYNQADFLPKQTLLFQLSRPLASLKNDLLNSFRNQTLTMREIYEQHSVDTPFVKKNYKEVLKELFKDGIISATKKDGRPPRKGTFADDIIVTFPG